MHSPNPHMPIFVYWKYFIISKSIHILLFPIMLPCLQSPFVYYFPPEYYLSIYYVVSCVFLVVPIIELGIKINISGNKIKTYHFFTPFSFHFLVSNHILDALIFHLFVLFLHPDHLIIFSRLIF